MPSSGGYSQCKEAAYAAASKYGINPSFLYSILQQESSCRTGLTSPTGNKGIAQLGDSYIATFCPGTDPFNPIQAISCAAKGLSQYVNQFGSYALAAAAYHSGPGKVSKSAPCVPGTRDKAYKDLTTLDYVKQVLARAGIAFDTDCDKQATNNTNSGNTGVVGPRGNPQPTTPSLPVQPINIGGEFRVYFILGVALLLIVAAISRYK